MAPAHGVDAVVLHEGEQQLHLTQQSVLLALGQLAFPDDLLDLAAGGHQLFVFVQKEEGKGQRHHGKGVPGFDFVWGMLDDIDDHGLGGLVEHVRQVVAGQGQGQQLFPRAGVVIKLQGVGPVAGLGRQIAGRQVNGLPARFGQELELVAEEGGKDRMEVKGVGLLVEVDEGGLLQHELLRLLHILAGEAGRLGEGEVGQYGYGQKELPGGVGEPVPHHLLDELVGVGAGEGAAFQVSHDLHVQCQHPAAGCLVDGQRLPTGHVQPGQAEVALRIRSRESKIHSFQPVDAVVEEQAAGSQLPGDDDDVESLAPLLGEELQQLFRGRQAGQLKAVQHQIGLLAALQIFQHLRQLG